jgi:hypothetical protein
VCLRMNPGHFTCPYFWPCICAVHTSKNAHVQLVCDLGSLYEWTLVHHSNMCFVVFRLLSRDPIISGFGATLKLSSTMPASEASPVAVIVRQSTLRSTSLFANEIIITRCASSGQVRDNGFHHFVRALWCQGTPASPRLAGHILLKCLSHRSMGIFTGHPSESACHHIACRALKSLADFGNHVGPLDQDAILFRVVLILYT